MSTRRRLLLALGMSALAPPIEVFAQQQGKVWRVGFLSQRRVEISDSDYYYGPFRQGMHELGYIEGKNLVIEWRSAESKNERLPVLATELVNLKVDVILTAGTPSTLAAQKATATIPIVMGSVADPVGSGIIKRLAQPGGNITGLSNMSADVSPKQLEMLLHMVPKLSRVALLVNPTNMGNIKRMEIVQAAGKNRGMTFLRVEARTAKEIDDALASARQQKVDALMVLLDPLFQQQKGQLAELAAKYHLPTMTGEKMYAEAGLLMSYGPSLADQFRRTAAYVDRIFKGAKPSDLPVEQPTTFELIINGKTAKALGLTIPQSLLISADKVIE